MRIRSKIKNFGKLLEKDKPDLKAEIFGPSGSEIHGTASFFSYSGGVLICTEVFNLPKSDENCGGRFFGFHIHEGGACSGSGEDPFSDTKGHYNPENCPHPFHKGDLSSLFSSHGYAFLCIFKRDIGISELAGKTVVIHDMPDDYSSQPSGNSGKKIACGEIRRA